MKITIVTGAFFPVPPIMGGAVEKVWFALGKEFARCGHEIAQVSRTHPGLPEREKIDGVTHIRVNGFNQPRSIVWLKCLDLIYSLRVRRVLPPADILVTNTFWLPILERRRDRGLVHISVNRYPKGQMRWYTRASRLLAVSRAIANAITAQAPELGHKVYVIPNPVPFKIENRSDTGRSRIVLFVGRVHPEKGIEMMVRAMRSLPADVLSDWKLRIVGPHETHLGGGGEDFLHAMQELGGPVEWVGPIFDQNALIEQYRSARFFVYPSIAETGEACPVAPIEAMANGCVVLVSKLDCFSDYIDDGVTGFVFDHRVGTQALGAGLAHLLKLTDEQFQKISETARARATEFAVDSVAQRYLDDFADLLAQR